MPACARAPPTTVAGLGLHRAPLGAAPDGTELRPSLRWEHPDDGNAADQTVFTLTLPAAVPPHATVTLDLAWEARVPTLAARTGVVGKYTLFGQWFPKLGVLEVPPQRGVRSPTWN